MNKSAILLSLSITLMLGGCAGIGKENRIGKNDGSDPCFLQLGKIDEMAVYYRDQRMKEIAVGASLGGGAGVLAGAAAGTSDLAMIIGGVTGAVAGGFTADAYWKNKLQKANNHLEYAMTSIEADLKQDIDNLTRIDNDLATLVRCRATQRDAIKKQFAEGKITLEQARQEWKNWGDLIRKDQDEIKYLDEALDNIRKIEDSYTFAANSLDSPALITEEMQKKWQEELKIEKEKTLEALSSTLKEKLAAKGIKSLQKKILRNEHKLNLAEINKNFDTKIKNKTNPKMAGLKTQLVAALPEKLDSINKNKGMLSKMAMESTDKGGFNSIEGMLFPLDKKDKFTLTFRLSTTPLETFV